MNWLNFLSVVAILVIIYMFKTMNWETIEQVQPFTVKKNPLKKKCSEVKIIPTVKHAVLVNPYKSAPATETTVELADTKRYNKDYAELYSLVDNWYVQNIFNKGNLPVEHTQGMEVGFVYNIAKNLLYRIHKMTKTSYKLLNVTNLHKYETDDQIEYVFTIVLQKETPESTKTKVVLTISALQDKWFYEHDFFNPDKVVQLDIIPKPKNIAKHINAQGAEKMDKEIKESQDQSTIYVEKFAKHMPIIIEQIFIVGYIDNDDSMYYKNITGPVKYDSLYAFQDLDINQTLDPEYVRREMLQHKKLNDKESEPCNVITDEKCYGFYDRRYYEKDKPCNANIDYEHDNPEDICTKFGTEMIEDNVIQEKRAALVNNVTFRGAEIQR